MNCTKLAKQQNDFRHKLHTFSHNRIHDYWQKYFCYAWHKENNKPPQNTIAYNVPHPHPPQKKSQKLEEKEWHLKLEPAINDYAMTWRRRKHSRLYKYSLIFYQISFFAMFGQQQCSVLPNVPLSMSLSAIWIMLLKKGYFKSRIKHPFLHIFHTCDKVKA